MCTRGVQGACPRQAVTSAEGTAERQRVPCRRHGSKACTKHIMIIDGICIIPTSPKIVYRDLRDRCVTDYCI